MRTIAYVDGFNLYYGSLKGSPHRWLDLCAYFDRTLARLSPPHHLIQVKYFTARVAPVPNHPNAALKQQVYLRALSAHCGNRLEIIEGNFNVKKARAPLAEPPHKTVEILKTEEKGSDVNLAVELVNDAWRGAFDCALVVSNDADVERAMRIVKHQLRRRVMLYTPGAPRRQPLNVLKRWAHKQMDVDPADLAASQLPHQVQPGGIDKPGNW